MINVEVIIAFLIFFQFVITSYGQASPEPKDIFYQTNNKILEIIDDVFISLRINKNFTKLKNAADYLSMHNFTQDVVQKNKQVYESIRNKSQTNFSNKTVHFISNIDNIIDEMIREHKIKIAQDLFNNISITAADENLIDFVNLARQFNLKLNTFVSDDFQLRGPDIKQQNLETRRIFNGTETSIKRYPFMASIHVEGHFSCAGSLIRADMVITAATCLIQFLYRRFHETFINVRVGSDYTKKSGQLVPIAGLHFHPEFHPANLNNNLMLIELKTVLNLTKRKVVSINYDKLAEKIPDGVQGVVILGWGEKMPSRRRGSVINVYDQKLSQAFLNIYNLKRCKAVYSKSYVTDQNFCAGFRNRGTGACKNDVGGPAIVGSTLMGVISFGSPHCGGNDAPTVFTKIGYYSKWIDRIFTMVPLKNHTGGEMLMPQVSMELYSSDVSKEVDHNDHRNFLKQQTSLSENDGTVEEIDTSTPNPDVNDRPLDSPSIFLDPNLVKLPEFSEDKTEIPHVIEITSPVAESTTDKEENSLNWDLNLNFIKGIVAKLINGTMNIPESQSVNERDDSYIDFTFQMTSLTTKTYDNTNNNVISSTPYMPFTRIGYFVDAPDTDEGAVKIDYEHEATHNCTDYSSEENVKGLHDNAEVVIMDSGTTLRFVLNKKDPKTNKKLGTLKEKLGFRAMYP